MATETANLGDLAEPQPLNLSDGELTAVQASESAGSVRTAETADSAEEVLLDAKAKSVDLTRTRQYHVPECLVQLKHLEHLCLRWNLLKQIDPIMTQMSDTLVHLDLYDNQIETIENLNSLVNLEHLDLSFNRIAKIEGLQTLRKLKILYLVHNKIRVIEGLENNINLEVLEVGDNKIKQIENVGHLVNLKKLYVGANRLRAIDGVKELTNLEVLSVPANRLQSIDGHQGLIELREIYLAQNGLTEVPDFSKNTKLEILDLCHNLLEKVSPEVSSYVSLTDFWARSNKITNLDETLEILRPLPELSHLYLLMNPCTGEDDASYRKKVESALPQVKRLDSLPTRGSEYFLTESDLENDDSTD